MANILSDAKKQEVLALGRLGWTLRRIEAATGVRRETAGSYLKAAGLVVRPPGRWGHPPARPAREVAIDPASPAVEGVPDLPAPPATQVSADLEAAPPGGVEPVAGSPPGSRAPTASACAPYRELIDLALGRGRNAMGIWQDLVDQHGFPGRYASVRRFVLTLRGARPAEAHPISRAVRRRVAAPRPGRG